MQRLCVTLLLTILATTAVAQTDPPPIRVAMGLITTHAEARRRLPNTVSDVSVTIEVSGRDLRGTAALLARRSQTLLDYLRAQNATRLRTDQTGFDPQMQEVRGRPDRITGYSGRTSVSFRTTPDKLPDLLAGSLDNGATGLQQSGSSPSEEELTTARQELAAEATQTAMGQAQAIARAVDQRVAGIQQIEVDPVRLGGFSVHEADRRVLRAPRPTAPIASEAGDAEVAVTVVLTIRVAAP